MFGVLVDVSGSMQKACALDSSKDTSVERAHAIITTILNIVNSEVNRHKKDDEIFVGAFGLEAEVNTCDLIALLDIIAGPRDLKGIVGHDALVALATKRGAGHAERWIREHLSEEQAQDLFRILCFDESLLPRLVEKLPTTRTTSHTVLEGIANYVPGGIHVEGFAVHRSEAYCFAEELIRDKEEIINKVLSKIQNSQPKSVQFVSKLLNDLNLNDEDTSNQTSSESLHARIKDLLSAIKPYIYGGTPMRKAVKGALDIFRTSKAKSKVLFILSDGESADGDPRSIAEDLKRLGVKIVTCYLTDKHIDDPKCLVYETPSALNSGPLTLFEMSSTMRNIDPPVSYLIDAKWKLPASGESRLFVQANSLDVVDELCKVVVSQLANPCDALIDLLNEVDVANYINRQNAKFEPKKQIGGTCYANAVAAVLHLAMHRIVGRDSGYPKFEQIRDERLIPEYGKHGATTREVLERVCPEYRLHFKEVDELQARQALNKRRPLVARFSLFDEQWSQFRQFFDKNRQGIIQKRDIGSEIYSSYPSMHNVSMVFYYLHAQTCMVK